MSDRPDIEALKQKVRGGLFEFSRHALDQVVRRDIATNEVREAFGSAELIEDYLEDKYGPSCLVFGTTLGGRPLHIVCSHPGRALVKIITVYEPDPREWFNYRKRR